jgi:hypothetical protein
MGAVLAILWNLPFQLFIWYPWSVFPMAMAANCSQYWRAPFLIFDQSTPIPLLKAI